MGIIKVSTDALDEISQTFEERNNAKNRIIQLNEYISMTAGMTDSYAMFY